MNAVLKHLIRPGMGKHFGGKAASLGYELSKGQIF